MWANSAFDRVLDTKEERTRFYNSYNVNTELLDVIAGALKSKLDATDTQAVSPEGYGSPSWAYKQADFNGYKRALTEVIQLLEIRESNDRSK